jgi:hypothetical protein
MTSDENCDEEEHKTQKEAAHRLVAMFVAGEIHREEFISEAKGNCQEVARVMDNLFDFMRDDIIKKHPYLADDKAFNNTLDHYYATAGSTIRQAGVDGIYENAGQSLVAFLDGVREIQRTFHASVKQNY